MPDSSFLKRELLLAMSNEEESKSTAASSILSSSQDRAVTRIQNALRLKYVVKIQALFRRHLTMKSIMKARRPIMLSHVDPNEWESRYTASGKKFYWNKVTGHRTWNKVGRRRASDVTMLMAKQQQKSTEILKIEEEAYKVSQKNNHLESEIDRLKQKLQRLNSSVERKKEDEGSSKSTISNLKQSLLKVMMFYQIRSKIIGTLLTETYSEAQMFQWRNHFHPRQHVSDREPYASIEDVFSSSSSRNEPNFRIDIGDLNVLDLHCFLF